MSSDVWVRLPPRVQQQKANAMNQSLPRYLPENCTMIRVQYKWHECSRCHKPHGRPDSIVFGQDLATYGVTDEVEVIYAFSNERGIEYVWVFSTEHWEQVDYKRIVELAHPEIPFEIHKGG